MEQYLGISAAVLGSLGGAGVIVVGLSSWLGKVWATRLMDNERHKHERDLEALRASLRAQNAPLAGHPHITPWRAAAKANGLLERKFTAYEIAGAWHV